MSTQTWILRSSLVLGMVAAVVTILYFTPMPEHHFKSCDRPCHELDWPMICRVKITLEQYQTLSRSCEECPLNSTQCLNKHCVLADGHRRGLFTANRRLPGPSLHVCQNDILLVDVMNRVPGQEFSIHWRGQHQQGTPCMDGVPMVTQCPISSFTTFQYKFRASSSGTHTWHAHSTSQKYDGIFGALVVRQPDIIEPQRKLYDTDEREHVLVITEWNKASSFARAKSPSILVNGRTSAIVSIRSGTRHRFRAAYTGSTCAVDISVEDHPLKIIALDGHPVAPVVVSKISFGSGERVDFVLKANQPANTYRMNVTSICVDVAPADVRIVYEDAKTSSRISKESTQSDSRVFRTDACDSAIGRVCLSDVQSLFVMPSNLRTPKVDTKLYFVFEHLISEYSFDRSGMVSRVNNITFTYPSSPLLTQFDDVTSVSFCNKDNQPKNCGNNSVCECVHIEDIPLDSSVELVLVNIGGEEENVFHLHGYSFYVVGHKEFSNPMTLEDIQSEDEKNLLFKRNLKSPVRKDTIRIPKNVAIAIRFVANNPGYWMLRDEHSTHWTRGLDVVLHVGSRRDLQNPPSDFPKCGNWVGPEFFLA